MKFTNLTAVVLIATAMVAPAQAANFLFQYDSDPLNSQVGSPATATLFLTTSNMLNVLGSYDILSASGTIDGTAVTGLVANPNQPNMGFVAPFGFDNTLDIFGVLSEGGIVVTTASLTYNFGFSGGYYAISTDGSTHLNSHGQTVFNTKFSIGEGVLTAVPEPASWGMMVAGFGLAGAAMRRRRSVVAFG